MLNPTCPQCQSHHVIPGPPSEQEQPSWLCSACGTAFQLLRPQTGNLSKTLIASGPSVATCFNLALLYCHDLQHQLAQPSVLPYWAIRNFAVVGQNPANLLKFSQNYNQERQLAIQAVETYAASIDNWQIEGLPFGVKDHCNFLYFFLNLASLDRPFFRGSRWTPALICELLHEWQGLDLQEILPHHLLAS